MSFFLSRGLKDASNKRAVVIGIDYGGEIALTGCVADAVSMNKWFIKRGFSTIELYNSQASPSAILNSLIDLSAWSKIDPDCQVGFYYSGHGVQIRDQNREEKDGYDEALVGYATNLNDAWKSLIIDDKIGAILSTFSPSAKLFLMFDCCHSGTEGDVDSLLKTKNFPNAIMVSGCKDNQVSVEIGGRGVCTVKFQSLKWSKLKVIEDLQKALPPITTDGIRQDITVTGIPKTKLYSWFSS